MILEIYRDKNNRLLTIPKDFDEKLLNNSFLPPVLAYVYTDGKTIIKAFDKNFTFLKETTGKKPCIPFIDCGKIIEKLKHRLRRIYTNCRHT